MVVEGGGKKDPRAEGDASVNAADGFPKREVLKEGDVSNSDDVLVSSLESCSIRGKPESGGKEREAGASLVAAGSNQPTTKKLDTANASGGGFVRAVYGGSGASRSRLVLKKGHAPSGVIEEDACDLIRNDFWEKNSHILAPNVRR